MKLQKRVEVFEKPLHSPMLTVRRGSSSNKEYGTYFIEHADTNNVRTVTTE